VGRKRAKGLEERDETTKEVSRCCGRSRRCATAYLPLTRKIHQLPSVLSLAVPVHRVGREVVIVRNYNFNQPKEKKKSARQKDAKRREEDRDASEAE